MKPKIIFTDNKTYYSLLESGKSYYILTSNAWNDDGYSTTFVVKLVKNGQSYHPGSRKILFDKQTIDEVSYLLFEEQIKSKGYVEIDTLKGIRNYISIFSVTVALKIMDSQGRSL